MEKTIIYQLLPRLFTNLNTARIPGGTVEQNGSGKLNQINSHILKSIKALGATHVWYTGVLEHATKSDHTAWGIRRDNPHVVKGQAGSPYAIKDYYDIAPDLAENPERRMEEFEALVKRTHAEGLKVVIDFVPNHVARQYASDAKPEGVTDLGSDDDSSLYFGHNNNFYYIPRQQFSPHVDMGSGSGAYVEFPAKATGNDCFSAFPGEYDWFDTVKLNYGVDYGDGTNHFHPIPDTWFKMLHILRFWAAKGVDAFRCDMVHMVPLAFWRWAIPEVKRQFPDIKFIAEIYEPAIYRPYIFEGGFDYLYDKVTLYDTLRGILTDNVSAAQLTNCWQTVEGISGNMLNFLENHDEQRYGSPQFTGDPSTVIPALTVSSMINTGPMMIYMGQELGEQALEAEGYSGKDGRTTIFDYWSLDTLCRWLGSDLKATGDGLTAREKWLRQTYATILNIARTEQAVSQGAFFDLMYVNYDNPHFNPHRHYAFLRSHGNETLLILANFDSSPAHMEVNIPAHAFETLGIPVSSSIQATELITGVKAEKSFTPEAPFRAELPPYGAAVWKINRSNVKRKQQKTGRDKSRALKKS